jgi:hypothetical protein
MQLRTCLLEHVLATESSKNCPERMFRACGTSRERVEQDSGTEPLLGDWVRSRLFHPGRTSG